jgi:predicted nucleic acid-binding protein
MAEIKKPFVILIDTNAMVALSLYVESCDTVGRDLGISVDDDLNDDLKSELNQKDIKSDYLNFEEIKKGYKLYDYLRKKIESFDGDINIWFSLLSEIELLDVFLGRAFDHELTRKGIPYRIRRKKPFRTQIDFDYEEKIAKYWRDIKEKLGKKGIEFDNPENPEKESEAVQDIIEIAKIVTRHVALEPVDLYLYASGIDLRVDEIYTYDEEFREIINKIHPDREWRNIYENIQQDLKKVIRSFQEECKTYYEMYGKDKKICLPEGVH